MQKKDLIQLGITGALVVVLIFALGVASKKSRLRNLKKALPKPVDLVVVSESRDLYDLLEQQAKSIELKRDPFTAAPITSEKTLQSGVDLTGILWDKDKPLAIINGEIVKKGVRVGGQIILDIKKDKVILSDEGALFELKLKR